MAWTAKTFNRLPSSLLEIRDWNVAREIDAAAALYLWEEELKRDAEREQRDREFWVKMFGGQVESDANDSITLMPGIREPI